MSIFSSSWCQALAAACDYGTLWTFSLTLFIQVFVDFGSNDINYDNVKMCVTRSPLGQHIH